MATSEKKLESGTKKKYECITCKSDEHTETAHSVNHFVSICTTCNPNKTVEEMIAGCDAICVMCEEVTGYSNDHVSECYKCKHFICEGCEGLCDNLTVGDEMHYLCAYCN